MALSGSAQDHLMWFSSLQVNERHAPSTDLLCSHIGATTSPSSFFSMVTPRKARFWVEDKYCGSLVFHSFLSCHMLHFDLRSHGSRCWKLRLSMSQDLRDHSCSKG